MGVLQDPQLRAGYDVGKIFEFIAELGGARNISQFKLMPQEQMQQMLQNGNGVPIPAQGPGPGADPAQLMAMLQQLGPGGGM